MKAIRLASAICALVLAGSLAWAAQVLQSPSVTGPSLGDTNTNLSSITTALQNGVPMNYYSYTTVTVNAATNTATQMQPGINFLTAAIGVTGTVALPTAKPGTTVLVVNNTGAGMGLVANASTYTLNLTDTINGTVGSTAYTNGTVGFKTALCFVPQGGSYWCIPGN